MPSNEYPKHEESEPNAENVWNVLFAVDLRRLVRASKDDDDEAANEIRARYLME